MKIINPWKHRSRKMKVSLYICSFSFLYDRRVIKNYVLYEACSSPVANDFPVNLLMRRTRQVGRQKWNIKINVVFAGRRNWRTCEVVRRQNKMLKTKWACPVVARTAYPRDQDRHTNTPNRLDGNRLDCKFFHQSKKLVLHNRTGWWVKVYVKVGSFFSACTQMTPCSISTMFYNKLQSWFLD